MTIVERIVSLARATNSRFRLVEGDLLDNPALASLSDEFDNVFHLAANPEVRVSSIDPQIHFRQNVIATFNHLKYLKNEMA